MPVRTPTRVWWRTRPALFGGILLCCIAALGWHSLSVEHAARAERERQAAIVAASSARLDSIVQTLTSQYHDKIAISLIDPKVGGKAGYETKTRTVSASIYKLYVAYGIYRLIDAGTLRMNDKLAVDGSPQKQTVAQCLQSMLTISDNECAIALGERYGWTKLDAMLHAAGYSGTTLDNYDQLGAVNDDKYTTTHDTAQLLSKLYTGTLLSKASTASFVAYLKADQINYLLPVGFSDTTVVAHKIGFIDEYQHDAGIVYGTRHDIVAVMFTHGWQSDRPESEASQAFAQLGTALQRYIDGA